MLCTHVLSHSLSLFTTEELLAEVENIEKAVQQKEQHAHAQKERENKIKRNKERETRRQNSKLNLHGVKNVNLNAGKKINLIADDDEVENKNANVKIKKVNNKNMKEEQVRDIKKRDIDPIRKNDDRKVVNMNKGAREKERVAMPRRIPIAVRKDDDVRMPRAEVKMVPNNEVKVDISVR